LASGRRVMRARVITVSDRCFAGVAEDRSGPLAVGILVAYGMTCDPVEVVPDEVEAIGRAVRGGVDAGCGLVMTTGGTGIGPRDVTPEAVEPIIDRLLPGIAETMRSTGREVVSTSVLSRGVAGVRGRTLIVTLPGSAGGVRDGLAVVMPLLGHIESQLGGGDHDPGGAGAAS
jgi:molybdenum cofactor synthesis domain-containing protein